MERALGDERRAPRVGPGRGHGCCDRCGGGSADRAALAVRGRAGGRDWRLLEVLVSGEWRPQLASQRSPRLQAENSYFHHLDAAVLAAPKYSALRAFG